MRCSRGLGCSPNFEAKGYDRHTDARVMQQIVDGLIDRLNEMQRAMVAQRADLLVHQVDLTGLFPREDDHTVWWQDELHPTADGFDAIATEFKRAIDTALSAADSQGVMLA